MQMIKKIVVLGPESTGKSTLCTMLAEHFNTQWCPEYAREYLLAHGMDYHFDDLLPIARGQAALEDEYTARVQEAATGTAHPPLLFIDTDMYVMKVWCEFVFEKCHQFILDEAVRRRYNLFLLCNIDLPWVQDGLREYPTEQPRKELYRIYKDIMINQSTPWVDISGSYEQRFQRAVEAVEKYCL